MLFVSASSCMKLQSNKRNHSIYLPILGCQNKYVLHWLYVLSGCVIGIYLFRSSESFNLTTQSIIYFSFSLFKPILGKISLDIDAKTWHTGFCLHFSDLQSYKCPIERGFKISAWMQQSSATSNTLWACIIFWGQITVQRYFVFVSTVGLWTL